MFSASRRFTASTARILRTGAKSCGVHTTSALRISSVVSKPLLAGALALTVAATSMASPAFQEAQPAPIQPYTGIPGTKHERTFIAIKPDGCHRGLIHEVIAAFEKKGYKLVAMKMMTATEERAREHYADLSKKSFFNGLISYFTSGPIVCMVWEGQDVILTGRKILGATNPNLAAPGVSTRMVPAYNTNLIR